jgi:SAM-dependent methyltransferase
MTVPTDRLNDDATVAVAHPALAADELADALRAGRAVDDERFDRLLPGRLRRASGVFWTPLAVVARAAAWLAEARVDSVVDIGSGAGKFCVAAALATTCRYTGLEHRARLVATAGRLARQLRVDDRVTFVAGGLEPRAVPVADAYYLYNPFAENRFAPEAHLDDDVVLGEARYLADIATVEAVLRDARAGTLVILYNGFGGELPAGYAPVRADRTLPNLLQMWIQR